MSKEKVLNQYKESMDYVENLRGISEEMWRTPHEKGKWTVAEVVAHFSYWDNFLLEDRIPYIKTDEPFQKTGVDYERLNQEEAQFARENTKESIIDRFLKDRKALIMALEEIDEDVFNRDMKLGDTTIKVSEYFIESSEHDWHHFRQINKVIDIAK